MSTSQQMLRKMGARAEMLGLSRWRAGRRDERKHLIEKCAFHGGASGDGCLVIPHVQSWTELWSRNVEVVENLGQTCVRGASCSKVWHCLPGRPAPYHFMNMDRARGIFWVDRSIGVIPPECMAEWLITK
eukprot:2002658-Amphidinium_carterae.1